MDSKEVSHNDMYETLVKVEEKVDKVAKDTEGMVHAFTAASGAFTVLEWIAKLAKPILWTVGSIAAIVAVLQDYRSH